MPLFSISNFMACLQVFPTWYVLVSLYPVISIEMYLTGSELISEQ